MSSRPALLPNVASPQGPPSPPRLEGKLIKAQYTSRSARTCNPRRHRLAPLHPRYQLNAGVGRRCVPLPLLQVARWNHATQEYVPIADQSTHDVSVAKNSDFHKKHKFAVGEFGWNVPSRKGTEPHRVYSPLYIVPVGARFSPKQRVGVGTGAVAVCVCLVCAGMYHARAGGRVCVCVCVHVCVIVQEQRCARVSVTLGAP